MNSGYKGLGDFDKGPEGRYSGVEKFDSGGVLPLNMFYSRVFTKVFIALLISLITSHFMLELGFIDFCVSNSLAFWGLFIVEIVLVLRMSTMVKTTGSSGVVLWVCFILYSMCTGMVFGICFEVYELGSVVMAILSGSLLFLLLALFGRFTSIDLSKYSSLFMVGLVALVFIGVIHMFIYTAPIFDLIVNCFAILLFLGLTAYDSQKVVVAYDMYLKTGGGLNVSSVTTTLALSLYLDLINIIIRILSIFGKRQ